MNSFNKEQTILNSSSALKVSEFLPEIDSQPLSLYFHVPFCRSRCDYCAFYSTKYSKKAMESWYTQIQSNLEIFINVLKPSQIQTIYFGGGTPSLLPAFIISGLINRSKLLVTKNQTKLDLNDIFSVSEISIEANPSSLTTEWIQSIAKGGVNRLTVGIQSFSERVRKQLGRSGDSFIGKDKIKFLLDFAKGLGLRVGVDLITGVEGQTIEEAVLDVKEAMELGVKHISLYRLTVEEGTAYWDRINRAEKKMGVNGQSKYDDITEAGDEIEEAAIDELVKNGFYQYEISNFSLDGDESLHNKVYWRMDNSLGLGQSAVSTLHSFDLSDNQKSCFGGKLEAVRLTDLGQSQFKMEKIGARDFLFENLMMGLRLQKGISLKKFIQRFGNSPEVFFPQSIEEAKQIGWLREDTDRFKLTPKGFPFLNSFLVKILEEMER